MNASHLSWYIGQNSVRVRGERIGDSRSMGDVLDHHHASPPACEIGQEKSLLYYICTYIPEPLTLRRGRLGVGWNSPTVTLWG